MHTGTEPMWRQMVKQQVPFVITSKGLHWYSKESVSSWTAIKLGADTNGDFLMPYIWRGHLKPLFTASLVCES